jgi:hypothetical protein
LLVLVEWLVVPLYKFVLARCKMVVEGPIQALLQACLWTFGPMLASVRGGLKYSLVELDAYFVYSLVWSFGGCLTGESRKAFDVQLKRMLAEMPLPSGKKKKIGYPDRGLLFDYFVRLHP